MIIRMIDLELLLTMKWNQLLNLMESWWEREIDDNVGLHLCMTPTHQMKENCETTHNLYENGKDARRWSRKKVFWYYSLMLHKTEIEVYRRMNYCQMSYRYKKSWHMREITIRNIYDDGLVKNIFDFSILQNLIIQNFTNISNHVNFKCFQQMEALEEICILKFRSNISK